MQIKNNPGFPIYPSPEVSSSRYFLQLSEAIDGDLVVVLVWIVHTAPKARVSMFVQNRAPSIAQGALHACDGDVVQDTLGTTVSPTSDQCRKSANAYMGAMMRKLIHVAFGVLKSGLPFNAALHGV